MRNIVVFLLMSYFAYGTCNLTPEQKKTVIEVQQNCLKKTGATAEMVLDAFAGKFTDAPEFKKQLVCVKMEQGVIDEAGAYHKDILKEHMLKLLPDEATIDSMLEKCYVVQEDLEQTAYDMIKCFHKVKSS
ncbi:uncharacterized protein LOC115888974 [Sitophilus oryzae]|uniref:Uncharacterized protein LOC115888974 n=1 Tax=Sitophilus oryzae TaxID=7048 RepID=A0A6J2YN79_SITOR|nr:uncharacterized protein LOC115888974 [Sitophilus oryzae]